MKVPGWRLAARGWRRRAVAVNGMSPGRPAHRGLRLAAALAVVACAVLAAQQAPPAGQQPPPVFRAATTLVEVDAIVRDKAGRFVDDLVAADFEVLEDGKPQAIEGFYLVRGSAVVPAAAPSPEPGAAAAAAPSVQRVFVLVFDVEHASPGAVDRARKAALKFLDASFGQGDLGGIVAGGTMANGRLTSDAGELAAAVKAVKPTGDERSRQLELREWPRLADALEAHLIERGDAEATNRAVQRACIDDPEACRRYPIEQVLNEKARRVMVDIRGAAMRTMRTLSALSSGLARAPGRKTVVLLSDGFFAEDSWGSLRQVTDLAARSATRFYALDTRGLNRGSASSDILDAGPRAPVNPAGEAAGQDFLADAPNSLAVDTGGLAIRNENDFAKALNEIAADTSTYYVLAYRPADATPDGRFRPLSVRVRRAGVAVRSRKGYVASPAGTPAQLQPAGTPAPSRAAETPPGPEPAPAPEAAPAPAPPEAAPVSPAGTPSPLKPAGTPALLVEGAGSAPSVRLRPDLGTRVDSLEAGAVGAPGAYPAELASRARAGWDAYQRGDVNLAREGLAPAANHPQAPPWVRYVLGWSEYALGAYARAVEQWEAVKKLAPAFEPVYLDLADGYLQQREFGKAVAGLREALERWPQDVEVYNALGVIQAARGALDDAVATLEAGVAVAPEDETANYNLAKTLELRFVRRERERATASSFNRASIQADRSRALQYYTRTVELKGALADRAKEGIERLTGR